MSFETGFMTTLGVVAALGLIAAFFFLSYAFGELLEAFATRWNARTTLLAGIMLYAVGYATGDWLAKSLGALAVALGLVLFVVYNLKES